MPELSTQDLSSALQWYIDIGWDEPVSELPRKSMPLDFSAPEDVRPFVKNPEIPKPLELLGAAEAKSPAEDLARNAQNLAMLRDAISSFEGLSIRKTATSLVFSDGNSAARLMIIGECPDAEDDKTGFAFSPSGEAGELLDKMMAAIGFDRRSVDAARAVYMTHVLNWRPPGNRTPNLSEIELSLPFLRRHIELVKPQFLLFFGALPAKALLGRSDTITKLRGQWLEYQGIPALVTYSPSFLIKSPAKKREVWEDLQGLQKRMSSI